jgi:hypothetical protein
MHEHGCTMMWKQKLASGLTSRNGLGGAVATVTLYTVIGGKASTSKISQTDFFRN